LVEAAVFYVPVKRLARMVISNVTCNVYVRIGQTECLITPALYALFDLQCFERDASPTQINLLFQVCCGSLTDYKQCYLQHWKLNNISLGLERQEKSCNGGHKFTKHSSGQHPSVGIGNRVNSDSNNMLSNEML